MKRNIAYRLLVMVISIITVLSCKTQTATYTQPKTKTAVVSSDSAYTDKIQLPFDDKGVDITVKMAFNEPDNILTLTLTGTRKVFVFKDDTYYNKVFRKKLFGKVCLDPEKLSYHVLVQPGEKVLLDKTVYKSFNKPRGQHLFNNWLEGISSELTMLAPSVQTTDAPEAALITDSIVQRFKVSPNAQSASLTLRNLLVIDKYSEKPLNDTEASAPQSNDALKKTTKPVTWVISNDKDVNTTYMIKLNRNPCFGLEGLRDSTLQMLYDITNAYHNLIKACPDGRVESKGAKQLFLQHKQFLRSKYVEIVDSSACPEVQANYRDYNNMLDSIRSAQCIYESPVDPNALPVGQVVGLGVQAQSLLDAARRLDVTVSQFVMATDVAHIHDLIQAGRDIIRLMNRNIKEKGIISDDQRSACREYRKAEAYFNKVVLKQ